jgi:acylphosphatase
MRLGGLKQPVSLGAYLRPACSVQQSGSATIIGFVSDAKQARRYFVSGIVQGVGFRYFVVGIAERTAMSGYTRNLSDGRVEVYAIGTPEQLSKMRTTLERGPMGASVSGVSEEPAAMDANYAHGFVITYED